MIDIWKKLDNNVPKTIFEKIYENLKQIQLPILQVFNNEETESKNDLMVVNNLYKKLIPIRQFKRKKGRKLKGEIIEIKRNQRIHSRLNSDNIKRKIKTHFHCFIISYLNLIIKKEWNGIQKFRFKKIDSEITQNITIAYNRILLNTPIREIIKKVSNKFNDPLSNEKILSKIPFSKIELNKLLNCTYMEMYQNYYLNSKIDLFINEKENNSFESHIMKIKEKFGCEYMEKYKKNALNFVKFFLNCKERTKKNNNIEENNELNLNFSESTVSSNLNSCNINPIFTIKIENN
jgi:hypothetical protein